MASLMRPLPWVENIELKNSITELKFIELMSEKLVTELLSYK